MAGKKGLVLGVANDRSIGYAIAKAAAAHGAELAFTYHFDGLLKRVQPLIEDLGSKILLPCDVAEQDQVEKVFETLKSEWGELDFVVHALAFSDKEELRGKYMATSRENFQQSMMISCFSFTEICRYAQPIMKEGGSLLTLSYLGAERVMPHYNVMGVAKAALEASVRYLATDLGEYGIRVNGISAGPIKTLAAMGIGDFRYILKWNEYNSPLRRGTTGEDVGGTGVYLLSDLASGVTGEIMHVDSGYHTVGMLAPHAAPQVAHMLRNFKASE